MPSLYGTSTTYTVTASNVSTLYLGSTSTAITATTYSTNLSGLYGGSYAALPTNAEQLIQLFDNNGNVNFYLDPATNSSTIFANFIGTASIILGNYSFNGNTVTNIINGPIDLATNGLQWSLDPTGVINLPATGIQNYNAPNGQLSDQYWVAPPGGQVNLASNNGDNYVWVDDAGAYIATNWNTTPHAWTFNTDGTTQFPDYLFPAGHGTAGQVLTDNGSGTLYWSTVTATIPDGSITAVKLDTTGVASSSTYLNGLFQWVPISTGSATTSSLINGSAVVHLNADGTMTFPSNKIDFGNTTATIQSFNTDLTIDNNGVDIITASPTIASGAALTVNTTGGTTYEPPHATGYNIWAIGSTATTRIVTDNYGVNTNVWTGRNARGTPSAPTAALSGDTLLRIAGTGYGTTGFGTTSSGFMDVVAVENFTDGAHGTKFNFVTTDQGSNAQSIPLVLKSNGSIVTAPTSTSAEAALLVNQSNSSAYELPHTDGYLVWGINKPGQRGRIAIDTYMTEDANHQAASVFSGRRARGSVTAPTNVQLDDTLARLNGFGYQGTNFVTSSSGFVQIVANENFNSTSHGGRVEIGSMLRGSTVTYVVSSFDDDGLNTQNITASGNITGASVTATTNVKAATLSLTGISVASPGYVLTYNPTTDVVGYSTPPNPFNQSLNTFDSPTFAGLTLNGALTGGTWTYAGSTINLNSNGAVVTASPDTTHSGLLINESGSTSYPAPHVDGYNVWTINKPSTSGRVVVDTYGTGQVSGFTGRRALGTVSSPTAVQSGSSLARFTGIGYGATGYGTTSSGLIEMVALENFTDTAHGTQINFGTSAAGATSVDTVLIVKSDGSIITAPSVGSTGAALLINPSNVTGYQDPVGDGTVVWGINKTGAATRFLGDTYDNTNSTFYTGRRARGTASAPSAVQNNDVLNRINGFGFGTTQFNSASSGFINFTANENFSDTAYGGLIEFGVVANGSTTNSTKLKLTATNLTSLVDIIPNGSLNLGSTTAPWSNAYVGNLRSVNNIYFADATTQTTAWTGSVSTSSVTGLATIAWTGKLSDGTGQISTSTVNGLSKVGYTNNYNDLTNLPVIPSPFNLSTVTNQGLFTTSTVTFGNITDSGTLSVTGFSSLSGGATISAATVTSTLSAGATTLQSLSVTTGTVLNKALSVGGYPLNSAGTGSYFLSGGVSAAAFITNYVSGMNPALVVRGYGQNNPGGTAATVPNSAIRLDSALGTSASPTAITANANLGGFIVTGFDGLNWAADTSSSPNFLGWFATEAMTNNGSTTTYQAGSGFNIYAQPAWTRPGINTTRQRLMINTWTTSSTGPSQMNLNIGSAVDGTAPTMTMVDGTTYTGYGRANVGFSNSTILQSGVPAQDSAPDNITLTGTNIITILGSRRSGASGRRNAIVIGDTLGGINFNGQSVASSTGVGVTGALITTTALDNFTGGTTRGTSLTISTVNSGTAVTSTRALLSDRQNTYGSDAHVFTDKTGSFTALSLTTSTAAFGTGVAVTTYNRTYGEFAYTNASGFGIAAQNTIYAMPLDTTNTANGISIVSSSRITFNQAGGGKFKIIISLQAAMSTNSVGQFDFWLRKNGSDIANTKTQVDLLKDQKSVIAMDWMVSPAINDYYEIVYASQSANYANLSFPTIAATASPYVSPVAPALLVNIIPVGA